MRKHRRTRRKQRGGFWPFTSSEPSTSYTTGSSWGDWFSNLGSKAKDTTNNLMSGTETALTNASSSISSGVSSALDKTNSILSTDIPLTGSSSTSNTYSTSSSYQSAGRRRRKKTSKRRNKSRKMKGGSKLGLTYYATPVSGIKMASPTTWI